RGSTVPCSRSGALRDLPSVPTRRSSDLRIHQLEPFGFHGDALAIQKADDRVQRFRHAVAALVRIEADHHRVTDQLAGAKAERDRSEEHTSELQSRENLVCRLLLEKKKDT